MKTHFHYKRVSVLPLALVSVFAGALLPAYGQGTAPQAPIPPKVPPATAKTTITRGDAQQMVNRVLKETSEIRHLSIKRAVPSGVKTTKQVEAMIQKQIAEEYSAGEMAGSELFLKQLGLAPANFDYRAYTIQMLGEQIAGYYDSKTRTFYTSNRVNRMQLSTIMAHELTHALQDQHFDLGRLDHWPHHDSDARTAFSALVEGDATFTMTRYMARNPMRMAGVMASSATAADESKVLESGPRALREMLTFPYLGGMNFVMGLYQSGGWPAISGAYTQRPQSSEQILHIEKYRAHEAPVAVPLRDVTRQLGKGWSLLDHDVDGEYGLQLIVGEFLKDPAEAERAAAGWGGDRYEVYRSPKGVALVVQDTVWDSDAQAREWCQSYARRSTNRLGVHTQTRGGLQVWNGSAKGKPNGVWMEQRGRRVVILEGSVGTFNPTPILATLWK